MKFNNGLSSSGNPCLQPASGILGFNDRIHVNKKLLLKGSLRPVRVNHIA